MTGAQPLVHDALFYANDEDFVDSLGPWLRDGLARGDAAVVATTRRHIELLRDELGRQAGEVSFIEDTEWYLRPAQTMAGWDRILRNTATRGKHFTRIVGEVLFRGDDEADTWTRFESALNHSFRSAPTWIVCPYDRRSRSDRVLRDAERTHPTLWTDERRPSHRYVEPAALLAAIAEPEPPANGTPDIDLPLDGDVGEVRELIRRAAFGAPCPQPLGRIDDLLLAFSEIAANSLRHGAGRRRVALWVLCDRVVCEVTDEGRGRLDPLAGYVPPEDVAVGGVGIWLARLVTDALAIRSDHLGTSVRFAIGGGRTA